MVMRIGIARGRGVQASWRRLLMTCSPECIKSNGESSALSGFRNGRSDPGRKAAKGDDTASAAGAVSLGMDTTDRLDIAVTGAA